MRELEVIDVLDGLELEAPAKGRGGRLAGLMEEMEELVGGTGGAVMRGLERPAKRAERREEARGNEKMQVHPYDAPWMRSGVVLDVLAELRCAAAALDAELENVALCDDEPSAKAARGLRDGALASLLELVKAAGYAMHPRFTSRTAPSQQGRHEFMYRETPGMEALPLMLVGLVAQVAALLGAVMPQIEADPAMYGEVDLEKLQAAGKALVAKGPGLVEKITSGLAALAGATK